MPTRSRTRNSSYSGKATRAGPPVIFGGNGISELTLNWSGPTETISDVHGDRREYNPCNHTKYPMALINTAWTISCLCLLPEGQRIAYGWPKTFSYTNTITNWPIATGQLINFSNPAAPGNAPWSTLNAELVSKLSGSLVSRTNVMENIATIGQTVRMVRNPFGAFRSMIRHRKSLGAESFGTILRTASSTWLEYRYGWNPIRFTIEACSSAFDRARAHIRYLENNRGKQRKLSVSKAYVQQLPQNQAGNITYGSVSTRAVLEFRKEFYTTRYGTSCQSVLPANFEIMSAMHYVAEALHVNNGYELMWELLPCSFVIDWLINSDLLLASSQMGRLQRPDITGLGNSVKESYQVLVSAKPRWQINPAYYAENLSGYEPVTPCNFSRYQRARGFSAGSDVVGLFGGANITHALDGAALIIGAHSF